MKNHLRKETEEGLQHVQRGRGVQGESEQEADEGRGARIKGKETADISSCREPIFGCGDCVLVQELRLCG
jgi:hypothetical protein